MHIFTFFKAILTLSLLFFITSVIPAQNLIPIAASQVFSDTDSEPERLFDNDMETYWNAGWDNDEYPAFAWVDLGGTYQLSEIQLYDFAGDGQFKVYAGNPENWNYNAIAVDLLEDFGIWKSHNLDVTTTHLLFRIKTPRSRVSEIRIFGTSEDTPPGDETIVFENINDVTLTEGESISFTVQASHADQLTVSTLPDFVSFSNTSNGTGIFVINTNPGDAGVYQVTVSATNGTGSTATETFTIRVDEEEIITPPGSGSEGLCEVVTTSLIFGGGDPGKLTDEQNEVDDPANGPGGNPSSFWFPGWKSRYYPAEGYLDLGVIRTLTRIFLRDINGTGNFKIYAGSPGNWNENPIVDDNLGAYLSWTEHTTPVSTRYLKVVMNNASSKVAELAIYGFCNDNIPADEIAPAAVTNLSVNNISRQAVTLRWSATGDDGNEGQATTYELRYSNNPINNNNFNNAISVTVGSPADAGMIELQEISGLNCNTPYYFALKVLDEANNISAISNIVTATTLPCGNDGGGGRQVQLTLSQATDGLINVQKAKLKYNKDFAYSLTLDDGSIWHYYTVFPMLNGGVSGFPPNDPEKPWFDFPNDPQIQENGFSYSDGCGNEVKFKAGLALNTKLVSDNLTDYHITWNNIREMMNNDWDIFSHGHNHCHGGCDYDDEVDSNRDLLRDNLNFAPTHFVIPSGDENYYEAAYDNGMVAVYDQQYLLPGFGGLRVDEPMDLNEFKMHRYAMEEADVPLGEEVDQIADLATNDQKYWMSEFAHRVGHTHDGEYYINTDYDDFKTYMAYLEAEYGKDYSSRKMWMAPMQEVYEYIKVRDETIINSEISGNTMTIYIDEEEVSDDLRRYSLSLIVDLPNGVTIGQLVPDNITVESYNAVTGLLNLSWE